jgi:tetratricopeptide (TPR) repeat protein
MKMRLLAVVFAVFAPFALGSCSDAQKEADLECFKGEMYTRLQDYDKAISSYKKAIEIKPDYALAHFSMGQAYLGKNELDSVIAAQMKAVEIDGKYLDALFALGFAYSRKGDFVKGVETYQKAIDVKPDSALGHNNLGVAYHASSQYDKAIEAYNKALKLNPNFIEAWYNLGNSYGKKQAWNEAIQAFTKATQLKSDYAAAYFELAFCYNKMGGAVDAANNLGLYYFFTNNYNQAIEQFTSSVKLKPDYAVGYNNMGFVYDKLGKTDLALDNFKTAARLGYAPAQQILLNNKVSWADEGGKKKEKNN